MEQYLVGVFLFVVFNAVVVKASCDADAPYRTFDGSCNNLKSPQWGMSDTPYARLVPAEYGDDNFSPRRASSGNELPNARHLSMVLNNDTNPPGTTFTLLNMQFGQFVIHDSSLTSGSFDQLPCCDKGQMSPEPAERCYAIDVSPEDPVLGSSTVRCMPLIRAPRSNTSYSNQPREQLNTVTSYLDLSQVYGSTKQQSDELRSFEGGQLQVANRNGASWPPRTPHAELQCGIENLGSPCYATGDVRANLVPHLAIVQIAFMREHNRIASALQQRHASWPDEKLFQEARRINIAQYQYIAYYEWLPTVLGRMATIASGLMFPSVNHYVHDYNQGVNPTMLNSHATAVMRYFHTSVIGYIQMMNESRQTKRELRLSDHMRSPAILEEAGGYEQLTRGLSSQLMSGHRSIDPEMHHFMFRGTETFGIDVRTLDIQRGRDHGLAGYNSFREFCGFRRATEWSHFRDIMDVRDVESLRAVYESVDDVEYTVAGHLDLAFPDSQLGWLFHCATIEQFRRSRRGDRFFFENGLTRGRLSLMQLRQIRKANIARILCDNTPHLTTMQGRAFEQISRGNALKPCSDHPTPNLSYW